MSSKEKGLLSEHPILAKLLTAGGPDVRTYRGYVGTPTRDGYLAIYPSLADLGKSFEIREADVLHVESIPEVFAPFGAVMVWVKPEADVAARAVTTSAQLATSSAAGLGESTYGRLRMVRPAQTISPETCTSNCECQSDCKVCQSVCRWTCGTRNV